MPASDSLAALVADLRALPRRELGAVLDSLSPRERGLLERLLAPGEPPAEPLSSDLFSLWLNARLTAPGRAVDGARQRMTPAARHALDDAAAAVLGSDPDGEAPERPSLAAAAAGWLFGSRRAR